MMIIATCTRSLNLARTLLGLSATAVLAPTLLAQSSVAAPPCMDSTIELKMSLAHLPGLAASIVRDGEILWADAYGFANIELGVPASIDTPFFLASISKTVTGVCLMQLRDQGFLDLDDNINDHLAFTVENPNHPGVPITFRHLLTHTSGIRDNWPLLDPLYLPGDSPFSLASFLPDYLVPGGKFYDSEKNFNTWAPGSTYQYCNQAVSLLGLLIEEISGQDFAEYAKANVFLPLGMNDTSFRYTDFDPDTLAMPYGWNNSTQSYFAHGHYGYPDYPAGTMRSSIMDLTKFMLAVSGDGSHAGAQILSASTIQEMKTVQYPAINNTQGLIFYYNNLFGEWKIGHDGGDPGVLTDMYFDPESESGAIILANGDSGFSHYFDIYEWLFTFEKSLATEVVRLGTPPNPEAFLGGLTSSPIIGAIWDPLIDHSSFVTDSVLDFLLLSDTPSNVEMGLQGTLLCNLASPAFLFEATAPGSVFTLEVPEDCQILGVQLYTQAGSIDSAGNAFLANGLDLTIGAF